MVTNETMAIRTARNIVRMLNAKGVKCSSDYKYKPIRKVLRECYYVKKLVECGRTDCIHIGLDCGSFIAITDDCKLMSGFHVMIRDAIYCIYVDYVDCECMKEPYETFNFGSSKFYGDEFGDCGMYLIEPSRFSEWVLGLNFTNCLLED